MTHAVCHSVMLVPKRRKSAWMLIWCLAWCGRRCSDWCLQARMRLTGMCPACPRGRSWTMPATAATSWRHLVRRLTCHRPGANLGVALRACVSLPRSGCCTFAGSHDAVALWRYHDRQADCSCASCQACRRPARRRSCWWPAAWGSGWATPASSSRCRQTQRGAPASCRCVAAAMPHNGAVPQQILRSSC